MFSRFYIPILVIATIILIVPLTPAQDEGEEGARDIFLSTRPAVPSSNPKGKVSNPKKRPEAGKPAKETSPVGLGYTLYKRDEKGRAARVDPSYEFHSGDKVRIMLEPNIDGYLYVFHTEGDSEPQMIFPDARLGEGRNKIRAHVPYEVPSSFDPKADRQWFVFYGDPAVEQLYVVVTREPLQGVPTEEELVSYCKSDLENCVWRPASATWDQLKARAATPVKISKNRPQNSIQSTVEKESLGRAVGLPREAPSPSVIRLCNSSEAEMLVTLISLIHR